MNEWSGKLIARARALWTRGAPARGVLQTAAAAAVTAAVVLLATSGTRAAEVPLFGIPIADQEELHRIATRLDMEAVSYRIGDDQRVYVADDQTARRVRALLIREDMIPAQTDPWSFFDVDRFSRTDFERSVNLQRAVTANLEQHLRSMDDIDAASVTIVVPERRLFSEEQRPATASIVLTPHPDSDLAQAPGKIAGIRRLIAFAVEGLEAHNIVIVDNRGNQLGGAGATGGATTGGPDRAAAERDLQAILDLERAYEREVLDALARIFTRDRVQIVRLDIDLQAGGRLGGAGEAGSGAADPVDRPAAVERTDPRAFRRVTAAVAIDGVWSRLYDRRGNVVIGSDASIRREYTPVSDRELAVARRLIADAIGFDARRGDSVTVEHLQFDRSERFREEDAAYHRQQARRRALALGGAAAAAALLALLLRRSGLLRRRRARRAHTANAAAAAEAGRSEELIRQAAALAREQPAEVARVLRAWLVRR